MVLLSDSKLYIECDSIFILHSSKTPEFSIYTSLITIINIKPSPFKIDGFYGFINYYITLNFNRKRLGDGLFLEN